MNRIPDIIRSKPAPGGYQCTMAWTCVVATGQGATRQEASGDAVVRFQAALWLYVQREGRA